MECKRNFSVLRNVCTFTARGKRAQNMAWKPGGKEKKHRYKQLFPPSLYQWTNR